MSFLFVVMEEGKILNSCGYLYVFSSPVTWSWILDQSTIAAFSPGTTRSRCPGHKAQVNRITLKQRTCSHQAIQTVPKYVWPPKSTWLVWALRTIIIRYTFLLKVYFGTLQWLMHEHKHGRSTWTWQWRLSMNKMTQQSQIRKITATLCVLRHCAANRT